LGTASQIKTKISGEQTCLPARPADRPVRHLSRRRQRRRGRETARCTPTAVDAGVHGGVHSGGVHSGGAGARSETVLMTPFAAPPRRRRAAPLSAALGLGLVAWTPTSL